jgi:ubiquinone/menaquinone biosynthesis C-methylase UbiE
MAEKSTRYIPALSFRWLTPLYDPLLKWGMREETFKRMLIAQANIHRGSRVLDLGCGTGTLTILVKQTIPSADVIGVDGDPEVLKIAGQKATQARVSIDWDHAMAYALPYPDCSFDRVLSSLVIHHLTSEDKRRAFQEIFRVLRPNGEFHIVDFGPPHGLGTLLMSKVMRHLEETKDNFDGKLPAILSTAGFIAVSQTASLASIFGPISLIRSLKSILEK